MTPQGRFCSIFLPLAFIAVFYAILLWDIKPLSDWSDAIEVMGSLLSLPVYWLVLRRERPDKRTPWLWFAATAFFFFLGDGLWAWLFYTTGAEPETPSLCDFFYLLNTATCVVGLFHFLRQNERINPTNLSLDMFISIIASAGLIYIFTIQPIMHESDVNLLSMAVQVAYPIGDLLLLFGLFVLFFNTARAEFFRASHMLMGLTFLTMFSADQLSLIETAYELDFHNLVAPLWASCYLLLSVAGLFHAEEEARPASARRANPLRELLLENLRILLPYLLTFSILAFICLRYRLFNALYVWAMALLTLLSLRQIFVLARNRKLLCAVRDSKKKLNLQNLELQKLNQKILHDAQVDFLTQLSNRRHIDQVFEQLMPRSDNAETLGLLLIDVDYFKQINDTYGHQTGDQVLCEVADTIRSVIRGSDIAGRFGGDEFIVLLPGADTQDVAAVARRLVEETRSSSARTGRPVSLSIGCTSLRVTREDYAVNRLLKQADEALYTAKEQGRDRYAVYGDAPQA